MKASIAGRLVGIALILSLSLAPAANVAASNDVSSAGQLSTAGLSIALDDCDDVSCS